MEVQADKLARVQSSKSQGHAQEPDMRTRERSEGQARVIHRQRRKSMQEKAKARARNQAEDGPRGRSKQHRKRRNKNTRESRINQQSLKAVVLLIKSVQCQSWMRASAGEHQFLSPRIHVHFGHVCEHSCADECSHARYWQWFQVFAFAHGCPQPEQHPDSADNPFPSGCLLKPTFQDIC